jgi:hypothetical protein
LAIFRRRVARATTMAERIPGVFGIEPKAETGWRSGTGLFEPGPDGIDPPSPMVDRIIAKVLDDWHPPAPDTSPEITVDGATLAEVGDALKSVAEWGRGGGSLRGETIPVGTSTDLTINLHANLELHLAKWNDYAGASAAAKKEWDRMIVKLTAHEQRHVDIAIEEFDKVAVALVGKDISEIVPRVTAANAATLIRQKKLDTDTDHGRKKGVPYGDVYLDTTIP